MSVDAQFMRLALDLAKKGQWRTAPNPAVGAVVVRDGEVVGRGWHRSAGTPHAEVHALAGAGARAAGATVYVTLEPCNHTGRTPPCTRGLLAAGVRRVVIGMADPNPGVRGGGAAFLAGKGMETKIGVLEAECRALNRPFIKHSLTGIPWVVMKVAVSLDGRIATANGHSKWVTGEQSRNHGHRLRDRLDAILIGSGTAVADNPSLTARPGGRRGRDPLRVVLDSRLSLSPESLMCRQESEADTLVFCAPGAGGAKKKALEDRGAGVVEVGPGPGGLDLSAVLGELGRRNIHSLLVEGGGRVHASFLSAGLYDEINIFYAPVLIGGDGLAMCAPLGVARMDEAVRMGRGRLRRLGDDFLFNAVLTEV